MYQAIGEIGTSDWTGEDELGRPRSNEEVEVYLRVVVNDATVDSQGDDISWCGAFVAWSLLQVGADYLGRVGHDADGDGTADRSGQGAMNWSAYGDPVDWRKPGGARYGSVVGVSRPCDTPGQTCTGAHVGFFAGYFLDENFMMLAGNQYRSTTASINVRRTSDIIFMRWPTRSGAPW
jgi:hypothetical protein